MILVYPIFLVIYGIVYVLATFMAVFLTFFVPFVISVICFVAVGLVEIAKSLARRARQQTQPVTQVRYSDRR